MSFFSRQYRRVLVRLLSWLLSRFGLVAVSEPAFYDARAAGMAAVLICRHSGFLRDGRYPGGRHAERKLRQTLDPVIVLHPWSANHG